jgi:3-isopropylmalate/(R)-2-methylmalate dehydratase small subunit
MKNFNGKVLFLDRSDINTDEIIPARYLTEVDKAALKPYLLEDLNLPDFDPAKDLSNKQVIITRSNFGCGSSREHAPWALEVNGINLVIAVDFARIFRQNMFNCGMLAVTLPQETIANLFIAFKNKETTCQLDLKQGTITLSSDGRHQTLNFELADFDRSLIEAGGWVDYADSRY